jgi:hypothetical protein
VSALVAKVLPIRECGHDEYWLRDCIYDDPSILGLGEDMQAVMKEKNQSQGGRLDLLLKDLSDDSMYEVELQLGETDPSHIIRTIEYWDNEKRRWPNRSHTAVLVAENITSRLFNVVQLLSKAVPIIGIQVNMVQVGEHRALHFTTVIDSYEEPEEEQSLQAPSDEKQWLADYPGALSCAQWYREILKKFYGDVPVKYGRNSITLYVGGYVMVWVNPRKNDRARVGVYLEEGLAAATDYFNKAGIAFTQKKNSNLYFNVDLAQLKEKQVAHEWLAQRLAPEHLVGAKR